MVTQEQAFEILYDPRKLIAYQENGYYSDSELESAVEPQNPPPSRSFGEGDDKDRFRRRLEIQPKAQRLVELTELRAEWRKILDYFPQNEVAIRKIKVFSNEIGQLERSMGKSDPKKVAKIERQPKPKKNRKASRKDKIPVYGEIHVTEGDIDDVFSGVQLEHLDIPNGD